MINNSSYEDKTNVMMIKITIHDDCYCYKLLFSYSYLLAIQCRRSLILQTMHSGRSNINNLIMKYQRFKPSGGKNIGIRKFEFVTKSQVL